MERIDIARILLVIFDAAVIGLLTRLAYERMKTRDYGSLILDISIIVAAIANALGVIRRLNEPVYLEIVVLETLWLILAIVGVLLSLHYMGNRLTENKLSGKVINNGG